MIPKTNLEDKIMEIDEPFHPVEIARVNDQVIRLAMVRGEYHWHKHTNEDELFYVLKGELVIQLRDGDLVLRENELAVIPRGVEHCPKSEIETIILMFEPANLESQGN
jgi:mannose-6-phosphate isomerase-like protein (cupin superfamily)